MKSDFLSPDKVSIIAEAGVNHNGDVKRARQMIDIAAQAGADAVKFQAWKAERLVTRFATKAVYQKRTTKPDESQLDMLRQFELPESAQGELLSYSRQQGIEFLSSPFDMESIDLLDSFGLRFFKLPSGEITNLPYLRKIGRLNKSVIMSTGMADLGEIEDALDILIKFGTDPGNIILLHCNTEYPTPMTDVNLLAIKTLRKAFPQVRIGYSDHTLGTEISVGAVALGAVVIEKHFTLSRSLEGPDHKASLEPEELRSLIGAIRNTELAMGNGIKKPSPSEEKNIPIARKSIVAATPIRKGERFNETNLIVKRPGDGISPMRWDEVIGKRASRDFRVDELIEIND